MPTGPDLAGRVALVTGASRGIGRAVALALAAAGADVAVNYRERAAEAEAVAAAIRAMGRRALAVAADVADGAAVAGMVARIEAELGPVDLLVNNAGIALRRGIETLTEAEFDRTMAVNLKSALLCTQAVLPGMRARGWGRVVNISSGAARGSGVIGRALQRIQGGDGGADAGLCRAAGAGRHHGERRRALADRDRHGPAGAEDYAKKVPMGRLGTAEEVAQAVLMVAGNAYMTGQTVQVNGGMHFS